MKKTLRTLLTALASVALALGFAVSPANAAPSPGTIYIGGPSGSISTCVSNAVSLYSDALHTTRVTAISGTTGTLNLVNNCSADAVHVTQGSSTNSIPGSLFDPANNRNLSSTSLSSSGTLSVFLCARSGTNGSAGNCSNSGTRTLESTASITVTGGGGGGGSSSNLHPLDGLSMTGNLTLNSVLTATPGSWSSTAGGAAIATDTLTYTWYVCDASDSNSTDTMNSRVIAACLLPMNPFRVLSNGSGTATSGTFYSGATLTLNQSLMTALNGKHLAVVVRVTAGSSIGRLILPTCGAIGTATTCSVAFGSAPAVSTAPATTAPATTAPATTAPATTAPAKGTDAALATIPRASKAPKLKFDSSSNGLGKSAKKSLKRVATVAKDGYGVRVTGAAGMQPGVSRDVVKALAKKRAMEIRAYLIKQGVPKEDIVIRTKVFPIGKAPSTLVKVETLD